METNFLSCLSVETQIHLSDGSSLLLDFISQHIAELPNVDFNLAKNSMSNNARSTIDYRVNVSTYLAPVRI